MNIGGIEIGAGQPCRFIAEVSNSHNGSLDRAFRMIDAAKKAGADFVKFQAFTAEELVELRGDGKAPEPWGSQGWTMKSLYQKAATPLGWFGELAGHCAEVGIPWFSSVFGKVSLMEMEYVGCSAYKLASLDRDAGWLFDAVKATGKPVIVSRPDKPEPRADATLWCPPGYPQMAFDLDDMQRGGFDGFSYHGSSTAIPSWSATLYGAKIVEVHFQLDDEPSELEAAISLHARQFQMMTEYVRLSERNARAAA